MVDQSFEVPVILLTLLEEGLVSLRFTIEHAVTGETAITQGLQKAGVITGLEQFFHSFVPIDHSYIWVVIDINIIWFLFKYLSILSIEFLLFSNQNDSFR